MSNEVQIWHRLCSWCNENIISYTTKLSRDFSVENNKKCRSCSCKGRPSPPKTEAGLEKMREAGRRPKSAEHCANISKAKKGKKIKSHVCPEETKQRLREANIGKKHSAESCRKMSESRKGKKRKPFTEEHKRKIAESAKTRPPMSKEGREKVSKYHKGRVDSPLTRAKRSASMKKLYATTNLREKVAAGIKKNFRGGPKECPNQFERSVIVLLDQLFPGEYKFVGGGTVVVDGLNPDFVNVNGQKKIIEVFGELFHLPSFINNWKVSERSTEDGRKKAFAQFGYSTCVIWCQELKDVETLTQKLIEFHSS